MHDLPQHFLLWDLTLLLDSSHLSVFGIFLEFAKMRGLKNQSNRWMNGYLEVRFHCCFFFFWRGRRKWNIAGHVIWIETNCVFVLKALIIGIEISFWFFLKVLSCFSGILFCHFDILISSFTCSPNRLSQPGISIRKIPDSTSKAAVDRAIAFADKGVKLLRKLVIL